MLNIKKLALIFLAVLASGCATKEFDQVKSACESAAWQAYPASLSREMVTVSRIVSVPDGNVSCSSNIFLGSLRTNCTQGVRYETAYDNVIQTVDANAQARNAYIGSCARRQCTARYGNAECDPNGSPSSEPQTPRALLCLVDADCGSGKSCRSRIGGGTICRQID